MSGEPAESLSGAFPSGSSKEKIKKVPSATVRVMRTGSEDIVVGENSSLEGSFETQGSMFVDGQMSRADLKTSLLSIGASGSVEGSAYAERAEIAGCFDGQLNVRGEVVLRSSSRVTGEIQCGKLISHRGATIRAQVNVVEEEHDGAEMSDDVRPFAVKPLNSVMKTYFRRSKNFGYGVFFTLGALGIVSLLIR